MRTDYAYPCGAVFLPPNPWEYYAGNLLTRSAGGIRGTTAPANIQLHRHAATLRRELRALLRKNKVYYRLTLPEDAWICEELYPRLMNWYWKKERVKALIEEEGVTRTAVRITRRVLKRAQSGREK